MKNILLTLILCVSTYIGNSQSYAINTTKVDLTSPNYLITTDYQPTVNLRLVSKSSGYSSDDRKTNFTILLVAGLAFTAASLLETGYSYGTNVVAKPSTPSTSQQVSYVIPPVYQQTPRNIMFCVGVGFTLTGIIGLVNK